MKKPKYYFVESAKKPQLKKIADKKLDKVV